MSADDLGAGDASLRTNHLYDFPALTNGYSFGSAIAVFYSNDWSCFGHVFDLVFLTWERDI
jgi:hypothetical protein